MTQGPAEAMVRRTGVTYGPWPTPGAGLIFLEPSFRLHPSKYLAGQMEEMRFTVSADVPATRGIPQHILDCQERVPNCDVRAISGRRSSVSHLKLNRSVGLRQRHHRPVRSQPAEARRTALRFRRDKVAEFGGVRVCWSLRVSGGALDE